MIIEKISDWVYYIRKCENDAVRAKVVILDKYGRTNKMTAYESHDELKILDMHNNQVHYFCDTTREYIEKLDTAIKKNVNRFLNSA